MVDAGIESLVVTFPDTTRRNDHWTERNPDLANAHQAWLASGRSSDQLVRELKGRSFENDRLLFDAYAAAYTDDPFLGAVERRCLEPGQGTLSLAVPAARQALELTRVPREEIDLLVSCSMFPDRVGMGDAGFIARELEGFCGGAFNLGSACAGSLAALQTACAFVRSGQARNVLLVAATNFSRASDEGDTSARLTGDGASAAVISRSEPGFGLLGAKSMHTGHTCGAWQLEAVPDPTGSMEGSHKVQMGLPFSAMHAIRSSVGSSVRSCVAGALEAARVAMDEVKLFVFHTSFAWNVQFCAHALGVDSARVIDTYPSYANVGPVNALVNLHHAAAAGRLSPGDLVVLHLFGGQAQAAAVVLRWGDPALGPMPRGFTS